MRTRLTLWAAIAIILAVGFRGTPDAQSRASNAPKLLVILVVDQLRADYLQRHAKRFQHGLKRLLTQGAVFDRAAYPYLTTVTCAGHATIGTGSFPATHGMINNEWWSREERRRILCTDDPTAVSVPYVGPPEKTSHSARRLRVPTLGDRLRATSPKSQVVTLATKPRSAVMLAGKSGTAVTWFVDATHGWATSSAFTPRPVPEVQTVIAAHSIDRDRAQVWTPLSPESFSGVDAAEGERPKRGWTASFPHPLSGAPGTPAGQYYELWKCSPFVDTMVAEMAASLVRTLRLGQGPVVDLLGVGFAALDCVGHDFGPESAEVHDTVLRLDGTLGVLLDALDASVGRDKYVVALSSDHGVSPIPERRRSQGLDAGRVFSPEVRKSAEAAMVAALGPGPHIESVLLPFLHFSPTTRALIEKDPKRAQPAIDAISKMNGVLRVISARGLEAKRSSSDPVERAAALSYHPIESGDLVIMLKEGWMTGDASAASHGTHHAYDQRVPVVLLGSPIKPGRYTVAASPVDIAPTLASLIGVRMTQATGTVLKAAIR